MKKSVLTVLMACMAGNLSAAGFRMANQAAAPNAMGNAYVAVAEDASSVWYNPAAMVNLEKTNMSLGSVMVISQTKHHNTESNTSITDKTHRTYTLLPHFYATHKLADKWALGLGVNVPFGLSTNWDDTKAITRSIATYSTIRAMDYNFNAAYKLDDKLSLALGLDYYKLDAEMDKWYTVLHPISGATLYDAEYLLKGDGHGTGYNVAAMYKYTDKMQFGANYRSGVKVNVKGSVFHPALGGPGHGYFNDANTRIHLPDMFQLGAAYQYTDKWLFSAEADYTNWATYHKLVIKWNNDTTTSTEQKSWNSVWAYRVGAQYKYADNLKFRGGAYYDNTPVGDRHLETRSPDADRIGLSLGAGWTKGAFTVDASYLYVMFKDRTSIGSLGGSTASANHLLDGKYTANAHLPAITVGYKF
jgi:long-chain fatty acid transport protein